MEESHWWKTVVLLEFTKKTLSVAKNLQNKAQLYWECYTAPPLNSYIIFSGFKIDSLRNVLWISILFARRSYGRLILFFGLLNENSAITTLQDNMRVRFKSRLHFFSLFVLSNISFETSQTQRPTLYTAPSQGSNLSGPTGIEPQVNR